ncbi:small rab-related GTPase [Planoprotostelium fungivorum]|uniref:Small rab-related GTPase n=1 Tax=Planoprotostelium fungivorum TaxID=1890364 RepID=A0A2P6NHW2_9EUKA|nr:small rab-related GTPase [Planoprotostelium fungivorum]
MQEEDFETAVKVLVVGNGGVGKSSLIRKFCKGQFTDQYKKTIGVDFLEKQQFVKSIGENVTMMVWDTAGEVQSFRMDLKSSIGQEEFDAGLTSEGAGAAVLAFSTTDRDSFDTIEKWKGKVEAECGNIAMCLIQNKVDLIDRSVMTTDEAEELAARLKLKFFRTSVKQGFNVNEVFDFLAETYIKNVKENDNREQTVDTGVIASLQDDSSPPATKNSGTKTESTSKPAESKTSPTLQIQPPTTRRTGGKKSTFGKCNI